VRVFPVKRKKAVKKKTAEAREPPRVKRLHAGVKELEARLAESIPRIEADDKLKRAT